MALPAEGVQYTFADALTWAENKRIEIINGEAVMMAPPSSIHQEIVMELSAQLHTFLKGRGCKVYPAPFAVRLFEQESDPPESVNTMVEPDISVVCDKGKIDKHGCRGAPDLVIEVLSPSTTRHDRFTKFNLYLRAGVEEYWIVDPADKSVQAFVLDDGRYTARVFDAVKDKMQVSILKGCVLDLSDVFRE